MSGPPADEPDDEDPPLWVQQSSLAEVLLWRMGIPFDRERLEHQREHSEKIIDLKPPITMGKVANAMAQLSMQLMRGELDATTAKTNLYALQTLLTALRLQIVEEKKPKDTRTKARKPAKEKTKCKAQKLKRQFPLDYSQRNPAAFPSPLRSPSTAQAARRKLPRAGTAEPSR